VLTVLKDNGYVEQFEFIDDKRSGYFIVRNFDRINNCGAVSPTFSVKKDEIVEYEKRYLPGRDYGILIITTPKGIMTNKDCKRLGLGGKLLAYFY
jgi:small subunit ribosomal protein S8